MFLLPFFSLAQTYNDGPIELIIKVRNFDVTYSPPADASLNFGGQLGFNPDELTFYIWAQDNSNVSGLGWQGGNCLTDDFDPPLTSVDFNDTLFNYTYPTSTVPQYFDLKLDAWQDNCGSDGGSIGFPCPGNRCTFNTNCCCVNIGFCVFSTNDGQHCDADPFITQMDYRLGPPCQWYDHGYVQGNCPSNNFYEPHMETYWRYIKGTACTDAISIGSIAPGGTDLTNINSNECYSNNWTSSPGNDVFYEFTVTQSIGLNISVLADTSFKPNLYLLNDSCTQIEFSDSTFGNITQIGTAICNTGTYYIVVDGDSAFDMGSFTLTVSEDQNQIVNADAGADLSVCLGTSITIGGSPSAFGGVPGYIYSWSPATFITFPDSANPTAFPQSTTQFILAVTDSANCTVTDTMTLTANPGPTVELGPDTTICSEDTIVLNVGTGFVNYFWTTGANDTSVVIGTSGYLGQSGTYYVTVIDVFGCMGVDSIQVYAYPKFNLTLGEDTSICAGESLVLDADNIFTSYLWNTGDSSQTITVNNSGLYSVQAIDSNTCIYGDTISLGIDSLPVVSLGNDTTICQGTSITLEPGAGYACYIWDDGSINQTLSVNFPGIFNVTVCNTAGCYSSDDIIVSQFPSLSVNLGSDTGICSGDTLTIDAGTGFVSYFWSTAATTQTADILATGTYWVIATDANTCTTSDTVVVSLSPQVNISISSLNNSNCFGSDDGLIALTTSGGTTPLSYNWSNGASSKDISGLAAGTYYLTVTDGNGCEETFNASVSEPNPILINFSITDPLCNGGNNGSVDLTAVGGTAPYIYDWSNASTDEDLSGLVAGTYAITITDDNNCTETGSTEVEDAAPIYTDVDVTDASPSCTGLFDGAIDLNIFGGNSPYTYSWDNGQVSEDLSELSKGNYDVTITDSDDCQATETAYVSELEEDVNDDVIEIPNVFTPNGDGLNDYFEVKFKLNDINNYALTIFNRWGDKLFETQKVNDKWDGKVNGREMKEGVYFCTIQFSVACIDNNKIIEKKSSVNLMR